LAPFSQNSNELVCLGSGQAQPGQSKPSGWFTDSSAFDPFRTMLCSRNARAVACSAPQPPAGLSYGSKTAPSGGSTTGCSAGSDDGSWDMVSLLKNMGIARATGGSRYRRACCRPGGHGRSEDGRGCHAGIAVAHGSSVSPVDAGTSNRTLNACSHDGRRRAGILGERKQQSPRRTGWFILWSGLQGCLADTTALPQVTMILLIDQYQ